MWQHPASEVFKTRQMEMTTAHMNGRHACGVLPSLAIIPHKKDAQELGRRGAKNDAVAIGHKRVAVNTPFNNLPGGTGRK